MVCEIDIKVLDWLVSLISQGQVPIPLWHSTIVLATESSQGGTVILIGTRENQQLQSRISKSFVNWKLAVRK